MEKYFFLETTEGVVSHNVLYYQPLPITHNQERFYSNNYFEYVPIVSTAYKLHVHTVAWEETGVEAGIWKGPQYTQFVW